MKGFLKELIVAALIAFLILQFIKPTIVKESSMQPTLFENNYIFLSKQAYNFGEPKRGDIIVFHTNLTNQEGEEKLLIKRVIGLPGDKISVLQGDVFINDEKQDEPYILEGFTSGYLEDFIVPEGQLFVMGDNRAVSLDSRAEEIGCVEIDKVVGKAFLRLYPFSDMGFLN
jgi:signal peptidase I